MIIGGICLWSGSIATIPANYALCDGTNGTPDLRDRFVIGAKQDDAGIAKTFITGVLLQTGGNSSHSHEFDDDGDYGFTEGSDYDDNTNSKSHIPPFFALAYIQRIS